MNNERLHNKDQSSAILNIYIFYMLWSLAKSYSNEFKRQKKQQIIEKIKIENISLNFINKHIAHYKYIILY